jgi:hypothetical protein
LYQRYNSKEQTGHGRKLGRRRSLGATKIDAEVWLLADQPEVEMVVEEGVFLQ